MVEDMSTPNGDLYEARCTRERDWWSIEIVAQGPPSEALCYTQARRLIQAEGMARDAIATLLEVDPDSFHVVVIPQLRDDLEQLVTARRDARIHASEAAESASRADAATARALVEAGITVRDAGQILGVSHQRVHQMVTGPVGPPLEPMSGSGPIGVTGPAGARSPGTADPAPAGAHMAERRAARRPSGKRDRSKA